MAVLNLKAGDTLLIEKDSELIKMKKVRTTYDYIGMLPSLGKTIPEIREEAIQKTAKDRASKRIKGLHVRKP